MLHTCQKLEDINEIKLKYTQNTEKILFIQKQQAKQESDLINTIDTLKEIKHYIFAIIGFLLTGLLTILGALIFIMWEFAKYVPIMERILEING